MRASFPGATSASRFYRIGVGTFDRGTLRLFDEPVAEEAMDPMLMVRNNTASVDQAKLHPAAGETAPFHAVCRGLIDRCAMTIARSRVRWRRDVARLTQPEFAYLLSVHCRGIGGIHGRKAVAELGNR